MKKGFFSVIILLSCCIGISGCIKNTPYVTTIDPYMTADIGTYKFIAKTVSPAVLDTKAHSSVTALIITGVSSDVAFPYDKIILGISNYKAQTGIYSIVQSQAGAEYIHNGVADPALGGIVAITRITGNSIVGYYQFQTVSGLNITNGTFSVGKPWSY